MAEGPREPLRLVNRLHESRSPYVRGHMHNPVAWQLWDAATLGLAKTYNRLLFVSIGYAACHWCHVMERESFESPEIAALLNDFFIPIKIDREERPDIDAIYMNYVQATTGSGGWPLNVFLTPDLEPVFGGTYFPGPNYGRRVSIPAILDDQVGFLDVLRKMRSVWEEQEERCRQSAKDITRQLRQFAEEGTLGPGGASRGGENELPELELLEEAYGNFERRYDKTNGGFSSSPKFPTPVNLGFLLRLGKWPETVKDIVGGEECVKAYNMVLHTLRSMARGGIRDQIGYGFARYSVTKDWSLPHFEKMLYDQAQLLDIYLDAFLLSRDPEMLGAVYDISTYLTVPPIARAGGGFFSSEDADSLPSATDTEKKEGAFYIWRRKEFESVLGAKDAEILSYFYGVRPEGNVSARHDPHEEFIGQNVLKISTTPSALAQKLGISQEVITSTLKSGRQKLREHREATRPRPALDDKVIVSWNGLAISSLARVSLALRSSVIHDEEKASTCLAAAKSAADFIRQELFDHPTQTLYRVYRAEGGRGSVPALAEDYAFLIQGLIDLYEATFDESYLSFADELQKIQIERFRDTPHSTKTPAPTDIKEKQKATSSSTGTSGATGGAGGFFTAPAPSTPHSPHDLLLRLKQGMDSAEPSANNISARNLFRLFSMLDDDAYASVARETILAFEAEMTQFPHTYAGMLGSVVRGRLGMKGVVLHGDVGPVPGTGGANGGKDAEGEGDGERVLKKLRSKVRPDRTVVHLPLGTGGSWLLERNKVLAAAAGGNAARDAFRVLVCSAGVCKEGEQYL